MRKLVWDFTGRTYDIVGNLMHLLNYQLAKPWDTVYLFETEGPRVRSSPASLRCGPWARHIYPSLVLVQPRKTCPCITERLLMGRKESNQTNKTNKQFTSKIQLWFFKFSLIRNKFGTLRLDSGKRTNSWSFLISLNNNICFGCIKETSPWDVSFTHTKSNVW